MPSPLRAAVVALLLAPALPAALGAQTVGGQIVALKSQRPLGPASVALVNDSARVVATAASDSASGSFYVDAPKPGSYRVFIVVAGGSFLSPAFQLDAGQTVERLFSVPEVPAKMRNALFVTEVSTPARALPTNPVPSYPANTQTRALVNAMFIVSDAGVPDVGSLQVLNDVDSAFVASIRDALGRSRFIPADRDGKAVAQVVQLSYDFGFANDPPRGDVVVRPQPLPNVQVAGAPTSKRGASLYRISADEFESPDVRDLSLLDAIQKLRPNLVGMAGRAVITLRGGVSDVYVVVDGNPVDDISSLRDIRATQAKSVEYMKREQAMVRYGTQHTGGALVITLKKP